MAITPAQLLTALRAQGVTFTEVPGWRTRGYDTLTPEFVISHHTAGGAGPTSRADVDLMIKGRPDLPGPLCNFLIGKDGQVYLIAFRRARHAGPGSPVVYRAVTRDVAPTGDAKARRLADSSEAHGNRSSWGIEVDHPGDASPYPLAQIVALVRLNAALCRLGGWTADRCIHHREWTRRKIDMSWRGDLRGMVAGVLARSPVPAPRPAPEAPEEDPVQYVRPDVPKDHPEHGKVYAVQAVGRTWMRSGFPHMKWLAARGLGPKPDPARKTDQGFDIPTWPIQNLETFPYLGAS